MAARYYHVRPLARIDVGHVLRLVGQWKYFVLRAPRQTGKTSTLLALRDAINADGALRCIWPMTAVSGVYSNGWTQARISTVRRSCYC